jgi:Lrp/AsnC family transcriptional regulator for asnA, asnC and gidA
MESENGRTLFDLDDCDLQIVYLLQENGRRSNSNIARLIGVSEPTVRKRIDRLIQDGIIKVAAILNPRRSGYSARALVGIRAQVGKSREVGEQLAKLNEVVYVGYLTGRFDVLIEVMLHTDDELFDWLNQRIHSVSGVTSTETFYVLRTEKINYDWKLPAEAFERVRKQKTAGNEKEGKGDSDVLEVSQWFNTRPIETTP